jgi:hypothetical protein
VRGDIELTGLVRSLLRHSHSRPETVNIYSGSEYDPELHKKILEVLTYDGKFLNVIAGRRFGKSFNVSLLVLSTFLRMLREWDDEVAAGAKEPWSGLDLWAAQDVRQTKVDALRCNVVTYSVEQYEVIQSYIRWHLRKTGADVYLHPNPDLHRTDRSREIWCQYNRVAGVIQFRCASQDRQLVGDKCHLLWLDECGLIANSSFMALSPLLWEYEGYLFCSGTPELGEDHWFTKRCIAGLPDEHPWANRDVAKRDPKQKTIHATALDAYSLTTREQAAKELADYGADSVYAKLYILADWRLPSLFVYDNWDSKRHVASFTVSERGTYELQWGERKVTLPRPDGIYGGIDWFEGVAPGGAIVVYYWSRNPLNKEDSRALLVIADEHHGREAYTDEGWWGILSSMDHRHHPFRWFADPHNPRLIREAKSRGLIIYGADAADKLGRIGLIHGHLTCSADREPALVVASKCPVMAGQFSGYQRKISRFTGEVQEEPRQYNDALLDSLAFIVGEIVAPMTMAGGAAA